jgi:hypothetical protein
VDHYCPDDIAGEMKAFSDLDLPRLQPGYLGVWRSLEEGLAAGWHKEYVLLALEDDRVWLVVLQERLTLRIELHLGVIVVKEVELHPLGVWQLEEVVVHVPAVRTD